VLGKLYDVLKPFYHDAKVVDCVINMMGYMFLKNNQSYSLEIIKSYDYNRR